MLSLRRFIVAALAAAPLLAFAQQPAPNAEAIALVGPGKFAGVFEEKAKATVESIDAASRSVVLKRANGEKLIVVAGDKIKNFEQIKVGDKVISRHTQALVLEVKKGGAGIRERSVSEDHGSAKPGEKPAGYEAIRVKFVADVVKVDKKNQSITLQGVERKVRLKLQDPEQIKQIQKGDQVEGVYAEAIAISVEPAPAKKPQQTKPQ